MRSSECKKIVLSLALVLVGLSFSVHAAEPTPYELRDVGVTEQLGKSVPLDLSFTDESGAQVPLKQYVNGSKPVILMLVYYECPMLCGLLLKGFTEGLHDFAWTPGKEFEVVTISINPRETTELATAKKASVLEAYARPAAAVGWHFLTGTEENIRALAQAVGFQYRYDETSKEYAHAAAITVLTSQGVVARYLHGIQYRPTDLRLAILEAGQGKIGSVVDHILMFCYRYDPAGHKYALYATNVMKSAGGVTVFGIGSGIWWMSRRKRRDRLV